MSDGELLIRAFRTRWGDEVELLGLQQITRGCAYAQPLAMRVAEDHIRQEPFATLTQTAAQQLMDSLWECGLRPSEGAGSSGAMRATEKHLGDMRKIVASKLNVDL